MVKRGLPQLLISLLGMAFIVWGLSDFSLGLFGERVVGKITNIRREGGERDEVIPGRYTYVISYRFTTIDGREIEGFTKKIGSAVYVKADGSSPIEIKYFPLIPSMNAPSEDTRLSLRHPLLVGIGVFLILFVNSKK